MEERTDTDLVVLARFDDTYAFELLIERYRLMAFYIARRLVHDGEIAQEVLQEATLQAYLSLSHLRDASRFKSWFYRIVFNVCHTWLREQKSQALSLEALGEDWQGSGPDDQDPEEIVEARELQFLVREAVNLLSPNNRAATWLFYYEQLSIAEVAVRLGISHTAVKNRLHKGRNELRRHLKVVYPEMEQVKVASPRKEKRKTMIQVTIVRVIQQGSHTLVVLFDEQHQRVFPLWLRCEESQTLVAWSQWAFPPQEAPLYDPSSIGFLVNVLNATGDSVEEVHIDALQEDILYATVRLRRDATRYEVKARVGEVLSLAVQVGSLIFVAKEVLDRLGMKLPPEEESTREQKLATVVEGLWHYLPPPVLIADLSGIPKYPRNLDFREGMYGWQKFKSIDFEMDTAITYKSNASVSLKSNKGKTKGVLSQTFLAEDYRGKRMRFSGWIKTQDVFTARLWITMEGLNETLHKADKTIEGTQDWTLCEMEVEIPTATIVMNIGFLMIGTGPVWLDALQFEEVAESDIPMSPQNLNFEQEFHSWVLSDQMGQMRGNLPYGYDYGIDRRVTQHSTASAYIKADIAEWGPYQKTYASGGVLKQVILANDYWGKRLRVSGYVKAESVSYRAGLFVCVLGSGESRSFDEMEDRPIQGTQDWERYEVIVSIPKESEFIAFGMVLYGKGQVWLEDVRLEAEEIDSLPTEQSEIEKG